MQYFDTIAVGVILLLAVAYLGRKWSGSVRRAVQGDSACDSCPGGCSGSEQNHPAMGMPLGDLRERD